EIEHQRETRRQQEVLRIFRACQHDKSGFQSFFSEAGDLVTAIATARQPAALGKAKRLLHTLKGNTALFGITSVSELCHDIESNIAAGGALADDDIARLTKMWAAVSAVIAQIVEANGRHQALEVSDAELAAMLDAIAQGMPRDEIVSALSRWQFEPT